LAIGQFFSQRFGYGVHALAYLATKPLGELTTLPELAGWMRSVWPDASETYLSNVMQRMARGRLLRSHRGVSGGYSLGRSAETISLRDVVELLEGVDTGRCALSLGETCPSATRCGIQRTLGRLEEEYLRSLSGITIADLAREFVVRAPTSAAPKASSGTSGR
jgi:Rrf2 family protein